MSNLGQDLDIQKAKDLERRSTSLKQISQFKSWWRRSNHTCNGEVEKVVNGDGNYYRDDGKGFTLIYSQI